MRLGDTEGTLGVDRILWRFRMQYERRDHFEEEYPDWDQCCTCWVFAVSEAEARAKVWEKFQPPCVMPKSIASCDAERFETGHDRELEARWSNAA